jgi:hypothetical protein
MSCDFSSRFVVFHRRFIAFSFMHVATLFYLRLPSLCVGEINGGLHYVVDVVVWTGDVLRHERVI